MDQSERLPAALPVAPGIQSQGLRSLLAILRRGWQLIAISTLVCLTLATIYLVRAKRQYQATARLLVLQQGGRPLSVSQGDSTRLTESAEDYMPTHSMIIRSPVVVARAIEIVGLDSLPSLADAKLGPTIEAIERLVATRPDRAAKVLGLSYRAGSPEEAVLMVTGVVASYEKFVEESYKKNNNDVVSLISRARDELQTELEKIEQEYLSFRQSNLQVSTDETGRTFAARRIDIWDRAANEAMIREVQLRSQFELGKELEKNGTGLWAVAHALSQLSGESGGSLLGGIAGAAQVSSSDLVRQLTQEQQLLSERYGPQYAKVHEIQDQIMRIQERQHVSRGRVDTLETRDLLRAIDKSLGSVGMMRREIARRLESDLAEAKKAESNRYVETGLREKLERHRSLFNTVVEQLKQAQFIGDFGTITTQTIEPPNASPNPVRPLILLTILAAIVAGVGLGVAAALVNDQLDQRIHSIRDIRDILGMPQIGLIPRMSATENGQPRNAGLICSTAPRSPQAEAFRAIRTSLELLRRNLHLQVILVTSPLNGDGKSTSASNLAISLALGGRKVLLVDADMRRPTQAQIHGLRNDRGLRDVLASGMPVRVAAQPTSVENLDLLCSSRGTTNPADLLISARLPEFIAEARQEYDLVIIDTPPIISVADTTIIASLVDGVLLVVGAKSLKRHHAERTLDLLRSANALVLGAIINWVTQEHDEYSYGYGYSTTRTAEEPDPANPSDLGSLPAAGTPSVNGKAHDDVPGQASH